MKLEEFRALLQRLGLGGVIEYVVDLVLVVALVVAALGAVSGAARIIAAIAAGIIVVGWIFRRRRLLGRK